MAEVHYRVLWFRRGGALGDRLVVGLVHWDGESLRFAFDEERVAASGLSDDDSAVRSAIRAFRALTGESGAAQRGGSLEDQFLVPLGAGSSLEWSPVRFAEPSRAAEHFEALRQMHRLVRSAAE